MTCPPGCEKPCCLIPNDAAAPKCTKHAHCAGRDGHGGPRVGLRRGMRLAMAQFFDDVRAWRRQA